MDRKKNFLDMTGSLIPGYNCYTEREGKENCDKVLRASISNELLIVEKIINDGMLSSISGKNKEYARVFSFIRSKSN